MTDRRNGLDQLTGLPTKESFDELLRLAVDEADTSSPVSLALFDVDHFLRLNEDHGREAGDALLRSIAELAQTHLPNERTRACRLGGDEFAIIMPGIEKEQAFLAIERLRSEVEAMRTEAAITPTPTVSIGISSYPDDGSTRQELIRKADDALYRAKLTGRNKIILAREEKKIPKTSHYTQGQLERLTALSNKEGVGEAELLREALDDLLKKYAS
jgi:diguanylate cyclase (GGDEF)-like protein